MSATKATHLRCSVACRSPQDERPAPATASYLGRKPQCSEGRAAANTALACDCVCLCPRASRLTLDMSGGWKQAKLAGRRPLDGRVRRLVEQSMLANHERQFATPYCARHEPLAANRTQATNHSSTRPAVPARRAGTSRRLVPTPASDQRRRCARARPGSRASASRQAR
jgi:hypothetical protein